MPDEKELDFFVAELNWSRGLKWYERHFDGVGDGPAIGEASPNYTFYRATKESHTGSHRCCRRFA